MKKIPIIIIYHQNEPNHFVQSLLIQTEYAKSVVITTDCNTLIQHDLLTILDIVSEQSNESAETTCICCGEQNKLILLLRQLFLDSVKNKIEFDQVLLEVISELHLDNLRLQIEQDSVVKNYFEIIEVISV